VFKNDAFRVIKHLKSNFDMHSGTNNILRSDLLIKQFFILSSYLLFSRDGQLNQCYAGTNTIQIIILFSLRLLNRIYTYTFKKMIESNNIKIKQKKFHQHTLVRKNY